MNVNPVRANLLAAETALPSTVTPLELRREHAAKAQLNAANQAAPAEPGSVATQLPEAPAGPSYSIFDIQGLLSEWGQANSAYDLDGNGTVGIADYLQMLANLNSPGEAWTAPAATTPQNADVAALSSSPTEQAASATSAAADESPVPTAQQASQAASETAGAVPGDRPASREQPDVRKLTSALMERLHAAGFKERPPINIHDLVDKLRLNSPTRAALMQRLQQEFGEGLGMNIRA